jgi:hypothetical protein
MRRLEPPSTRLVTWSTAASVLRLKWEDAVADVPASSDQNFAPGAHGNAAAWRRRKGDLP